MNATGVPLGHSNANEPADALTGSLNVTVTAWPSGTFVAPDAGVVLVTTGVAPVVNEKTKSAAIGTPEPVAET